MRRLMLMVAVTALLGGVVAAQMTMQQSPTRDSMAAPTGPAAASITTMDAGMCAPACPTGS